MQRTAQCTQFPVAHLGCSCLPPSPCSPKLLIFALFFVCLQHLHRRNGANISRRTCCAWASAQPRSCLNIVREIPLLRTKANIDQTGRYLYDRLRERRQNLENDEDVRLVKHCRPCEKSLPYFDGAKVLGKDMAEHKLLKAYHMRESGENCVSEASIVL